MTKKRLAWLCLLVSPLVLGGATFCLSDRDPISKANCAKIKKGMTDKEVEALLGKKCDREFGYTNCWSHSDADRTLHWFGERGRIYVDLAGTVVESAQYVPCQPETVIEKIRNWLGL